jgi:hypothetical protein
MDERKKMYLMQGFGAPNPCGQIGRVLFPLSTIVGFLAFLAVQITGDVGGYGYAELTGYATAMTRCF